MSKFFKFALTGVTIAGLAAGTLPAQAAPLPAQAGMQVDGPIATVETVGWRRGYYGGYGYRRGGGIGGALVAGAALGLIGTAIAASARPRYGYYGGYGYARPAYGYGYGYPAYGYGYPAYGYGGYPGAW